jgi:hypothetical protein
VFDEGSHLLLVVVVAPSHPLRLNHRLWLTFEPIFPSHPIVFLNLGGGFFGKVIQVVPVRLLQLRTEIGVDRRLIFAVDIQVNHGKHFVLVTYFFDLLRGVRAQSAIW